MIGFLRFIGFVLLSSAKVLAVIVSPFLLIFIIFKVFISTYDESISARASQAAQRGEAVSYFDLYAAEWDQACLLGPYFEEDEAARNGFSVGYKCFGAANYDEWVCLLFVKDSKVVAWTELRRETADKLDLVSGCRTRSMAKAFAPGWANHVRSAN